MGNRRQQLDGGKVLWFIGDAKLRAIAESVAVSIDAEILDTCTENATYEDVRTVQILNVQMRRRRTPVDVLLYLDISDYDAEGLIWAILNVVKEGSKIILVVKPANDRTVEAAEHFDSTVVKLIAVDNFDNIETLIYNALNA